MEEGTPECLVFEGGSYTLAQRLGGRPMSLVERRATAYGVSHPNLPGVFVTCIFQILEALRQLHDRDVVHGNLQPSCIVWSSTDFCWKFLDLEFAATFCRDSIPLRERTATRYMAPEVQQAFQKNQDSVKADFATDMWSFGLIAFEIFTGAPFLRFCVALRHFFSRSICFGLRAC